ncbi:MAG: hypothetical protein ABS942_11100 [Solibacillus sp.]
MSKITEELLAEFKERMKLSDEENDNLTRILNASEQDLFDVCGRRDIAEDVVYKELVFERARYVYNDALEYFERNFQHRINKLAIEAAVKEKGDADATI